MTIFDPGSVVYTWSGLDTMKLLKCEVAWVFVNCAGAVYTLQEISTIGVYPFQRNGGTVYATPEDAYEHLNKAMLDNFNKTNNAE